MARALLLLDDVEHALTQIREAANELSSLAQTSLVSIQRCCAPNDSAAWFDDLATT